MQLLQINPNFECFNLAKIDVPFNDVLHGNHCCVDDSHKCLLENYYCDIMNAVINAESILPKTNPNSNRSFWDSELSELKSRSVECTNYWKSHGCPKSGPVYNCRKKCHFLYKSSLRRKKQATEKEYNDALYCDLVIRTGFHFGRLGMI